LNPGWSRVWKTNFQKTHVMSSMNLVQLMAAEFESKLYDNLHQLLGQIAEDYDLSHGELVDRYLKYEKMVDAPKVIYKTTEEIQPEERPKRQVKVTKKKAESDEQADDNRKGKCEGKTAKGLPCKNRSQPGCCLCHIHLKKSDSDEKTPKKSSKKETVKTPDAPKKGRGRKAKKVAPVHMHPLDETPVECDLCESHGNAIDGDQEFEVDEAAVKREALRSILAEELGEEEGAVTDEMLEEFEAEMDKDEVEEVEAEMDKDEVEEVESEVDKEDGEIGEEELD